jgi:hypothetical protein
MVTSPASPEVLIVKQLVLPTSVTEKQFLYLLCYVSACPDFSDHIVRYDISSERMQGSYGPCECSRLQIWLTDGQQT